MDGFVQQISADKNIYLCLSGGGFRAAFFHLGVIRSLRKNNLLGSVKTICSVSGGSIMAAHLVNSWPDFLGDDKRFEAACDRLVEFGQRDIRGRILRRWFLTLRWWGYGRVKSLAKEYRRFFGNKSIADLYRQNADPSPVPPPDVHFLATSFTSGNPCSFSSDFFSTLSGGDGFNDVPADLIKLDLAVAASSAFPPLFPPVWLKNDDFGQALGTDEGIYLTDGGVYDNLGIDYCAALIERLADKNAAIVLSNAGGAFDVQTKGFSWILPRTIRTTDILMWRAAAKTVERLGALATVPSAHISINQISDKSVLSTTVQKFIRQIRTDLDKFSRKEVAILTAHGEAVADMQFSVTPAPGQSANLLNMSHEEMVEVLKAARKRKWFNFADPATYAILLIPFVLIAGCLWLASNYWSLSADYTAASVDLTAARSDLTETAADVAALEDRNRVLQQQQVAAEPPTTSPVDAPSDYTVYIQFAGFARPQVAAAAQQLSGQFKWSVPAASQGGQRTVLANRLNEIRIGGEADRATAQRLGDDLVKTGLVAQPPKIEVNPKIPLRTLEIWVGQR